MKNALKFVALVAVAVASLIAFGGQSHGPRPGPLWERTAVATPAPGCTVANATWDAGEAPMSFAVAGDSVLAQTRPQLIGYAEARCHTVTVIAKSGGAPCDELDQYGADMSSQPLQRIALSWIGNVGSSSCMVSQMGTRFGTDRWIPGMQGPGTLTADEITYAGQLYQQALTTMIRWNLAKNIVTVFVLPPPMRAGTYHNQMQQQLLDRYVAMSNAYGGVGYTDLPRQALGGNTWTMTKDGETIRHTDFTHLRAPAGTGRWALGLVDGITLT